MLYRTLIFRTILQIVIPAIEVMQPCISYEDLEAKSLGQWATYPRWIGSQVNMRNKLMCLIRLALNMCKRSFKISHIKNINYVQVKVFKHGFFDLVTYANGQTNLNLYLLSPFIFIRFPFPHKCLSIILETFNLNKLVLS